MQVDLHLHTTASDGRLSPGELVRLASRQGLRFIAITDHDSVEGIAEALKASQDFPTITVIPGVELSTDIPNSEVHVLGYFMDYRDGELNSALARLRNSREIRARGMLAKLAGLGIYINWGRVLEIAGDGAVGRPHVAQAMLEKGYVSSFKEAFTRYIGRNGPAYVEREKLTPPEAVALIVRARGLPVLAHPADIKDLEDTLVELKQAGLVGMEVYYSNYTTETIARLKTIAQKHELLALGGSDYHGLNSSDEIQPGDVAVPLEAAEALIALAKKHGRLPHDP